MKLLKTFLAKLNGITEKLVPVPLYFLTSHKISSRITRDNCRHNDALPFPDTPIYNQYSDTVSRFRIGRCSASYNGCASAALYNAFLCKNCPQSFARLIFLLETSGCLSLNGRLGTSPYRLERILKLHPVSYSRHRSLEELEHSLCLNDAAILFIWNDRSNLAKGAHFFTVQKQTGGYRVFNRLSPVSDTSGLASIVGSGRFITGYRIF